MAQVITATFENGVLKPTQPLQLPPNCRVQVTVQPLDDAQEQLRRQQAWQDLEQLWQNPIIDSQGQRLTRQQLHERR